MACAGMHPASADSCAVGRAASATTPSRRPTRWAARLAFLIPLLIAVLGAQRAALADPIKASVNANASGGFARLVFTMSDYDAATIRQQGSVLIITFKEPIDVSVDKLAAQVPDYIGAARRDPDGMAVRLALAQKVTVNAIAADEKYFVDLLPEKWSGSPPGLPQEVIENLARRAREAEKLVAREQRLVALEKIPPVRVRVASEPTFTRYVFVIPDQISVEAAHEKSGLSLTFDAPLRFDLGDAEASLPAAVRAIAVKLHDGSATVHFDLNGGAETRTFRDENGYAVDVVGAGAKAAAENPAFALPAALAPLARPSPPAPAPAAGSPPAASPAAALPAAASPSAASLAVAAASPAAKATPAVTAPALPVAAAAPPSPPAKPTALPAAAPNTPAPAAPAVVKANAQAPVENQKPAQAPPVAVAAPASPAPANPPAPKPAITKEAAKVPPGSQATGKIPVELARDGVKLKLSFDFMAPVAAAVFDRADTLWLVFDARQDIDLSALKDEASRTIRSAELIRAPDADIVRIKLDRPHLSSVTTEGPVWILEIGDSVAEPMHALDLERNLIGRNRSTMTIPLEAPHALHRITDPEAGDQLLVVTAFAPARGVIHTQNFLEFRALASEQGVVVEPIADDITLELAPDKVVIGRPGGLTLSSSLQSVLRGTGLRPLTFDPQLWGFDRKGSYEERQSDLIAAAAAAPENKRLQPRLDLARFYLARSMYEEAKGVLDVVLAEERPASEDVSAIVLRAVAEIMMGRPAAALKDLSDPAVGDQHDAPLWRALAYARQGKWQQARQSFKNVEAAIATLPIELQRFALKEEMRASIEVGDLADAENELNDLETIGIPHDMQPAMSVLIGRLDEGLGRNEDALTAYRAAADSWDRPAAAQGRLRETALRYSLGDLKRDEVVNSLESLTTVWRGDETEIEALKILARIYTEEGRYRDSFYVMRSAMAAHPDWDMTRKIQEEAARTFDSLFLAGKGDSLSAIDALALFYDFRELTPIGSRGDEMIRRLADRLVSVDLLDQAAGLLQYQVDNRLQGAARAEVATRLAVIYLMNRKPDKAVATLRATRSADLSTELHDERLLLEARALSDLGQRDLALEVTADIKGPVAIRLRSDIYWAAHKWDDAAEQIELLYGDRWKQWQPLSDVERADILRAELGYALAEDKIGLDRFGDRYAPKMAGTADARAFAIISAPLGTGGDDFKDIAHAAAAEDTLDDFLRDLRAYYPQSNPVSSQPVAAASAPPETAAPAPASPPQTRPAVPAVPALPGSPSAAVGHTAMR